MHGVTGVWFCLDGLMGGNWRPLRRSRNCARMRRDCPVDILKLKKRNRCSCRQIWAHNLSVSGKRAPGEDIAGHVMDGLPPLTVENEILAAARADIYLDATTLSLRPTALVTEVSPTPYRPEQPLQSSHSLNSWVCKLSHQVPGASILQCIACDHCAAHPACLGNNL